MESAGGEWLAAPAPGLLEQARLRIRRQPAIRGVILVGGYDVVPSRILLALPPELRGLETRDSDRMQVWSDDEYGDRDRTGVPSLPVSRVPDGGEGGLLLRSLGAPLPSRLASRAGIRNTFREFADQVYAALPGGTEIGICEPPRPAVQFGNDVLYLMLHGSWKDTSRFRGESAEDLDPYPVGIEAGHIPDPCPPIVFAGCCYGALTVTRRARESTPLDSVEPVAVQSSIAMTCLARGANAFVGCTGVHYSPVRPNYRYLGEPMHRFFFEELLAGNVPAMALFLAKVRYAKAIPFRGAAASRTELAAEHKILRQFTCLGIGW